MLNTIEILKSLNMDSSFSLYAKFTTYIMREKSMFDRLMNNKCLRQDKQESGRVPSGTYTMT